MSTLLGSGHDTEGPCHPGPSRAMSQHAAASADTACACLGAETLPCVQASFVLLEHTDHVTALAAAPAAGLMVSGGLSSQLFLWDVPTATRLQPPAVRTCTWQCENCLQSHTLAASTASCSKCQDYAACL